MVETECISYRFKSVAGTYPDYEKLIPSDFVAEAHFDTREASKAVASLSALSVDKGVAIHLTVKDGGVTLAVLEDRDQATIEAEASGEMETAMNSRYLMDTLKALGGIADVRLGDTPAKPILFSADGFRAVVMPVNVPAKPKVAEQAVATQAQETEATTEEPQETQAETPRRRRKAREPVGATA